MDDRRFDLLARRVSHVSRRHWLRGLGTAVLASFLPRIGGGAAQLEGTVVVGGPCNSTSECRQRDMQRGAVCADNGFTSDGGLNCCLESGCCESDADCCGTKRCAPTSDVCFVCAEPPFPTRQPGQLCDSDSDCIWSGLCESTQCRDGRCLCIRRQPAPAHTAVPSRPSVPTASQFPDVPDADAALAAAEALSLLELTGKFDALYDRMHPDAQSVIPREVVVGWYQEDATLSGSRPATALKVRFIPWTWEVTGQTYPNTAEVAFEQLMADGSVIRDEIRLVKDWHGEWAWFFGRSRDFVAEQISRFTDQ